MLSPAADFYEFTAENGTRKTQNFSLPLSSTISTATFRKGSRLLYYKTDVGDGCDSQLDFLKPKFAVSAFPPSKSSPSHFFGFMWNISVDILCDVFVHRPTLFLDACFITLDI